MSSPREHVLQHAWPYIFRDNYETMLPIRFELSSSTNYTATRAALCILCAQLYCLGTMYFK